MISLVLASGFLLAAAPADPIASPRKAYSACIKTLIASSLDGKVEPGAFDSALSSNCAAQEASFRNAIIQQQLAANASRKDAERAAADWVSDQQSNAKNCIANISRAGHDHPLRVAPIAVGQTRDINGVKDVCRFRCWRRRAEMMLVPTYVAPSRIEGVGVFAAEPIPEGAQIWQLAPTLDRLIPRHAVVDLPPFFQSFVERYSYPYPHDPELLIVELDNGRFMNHSERPNTCFDDPDAGYTLRRIEVGEELTCNYAEFDPTFEILPGRLFVEPERELLPQPVG